MDLHVSRVRSPGPPHPHTRPTWTSFVIVNSCGLPSALQVVGNVGHDPREFLCDQKKDATCGGANERFVRVPVLGFFFFFLH